MSRIKPNALGVYIAGPYTHGNIEENVFEALRIMNLVMLSGHVPFVPHLSHHAHMAYPHDYAEWMDVDLFWLRKSDIVFRIPGYSPGADREVAEAAKLGTPVFYTEQELLDYLQELELTEGVSV